MGSVVKFPKQIGPQFANRVLPWVETFWANKRRYPTTDEFCDRFKFTLEQVELLHQSPFWLKCLERRGINYSGADLTALQVAAISLITNFSDRRSIPVKMAAIGVTEEQINGWYCDPVFQRELASRADASLNYSFPEVQANLIRQIQKGNFQATKFYYEITGRATTPEQQNLKQTVQILIEAVQKHVKDPAVLEAIASEVQSLSTLSTPVAGAAGALPVSQSELSQLG